MTFRQLSEYLFLLEQTSSRLKITEILAELFVKAQEDEMDRICYLSLGRLLPAYEGLEFQMAEKMMIRAITKAVGTSIEETTKEYKKVGDLGEVAEKLKERHLNKRAQDRLLEIKEEKDRGELSINRVYERLIETARESGSGSVERKIDKMASLLEDLDSLSVRFVVRIPLSKLRLGFSEMTILDALSWMVEKDKSLRSSFEDAYNVLADIGEIAKRIKKDGGIKKINPEVGTPILPALAQRLGTVEEMLEKVGTEEGVALEPKYDGERLQIHLGKEIKIFTRNMENVTSMFPDIVALVRKEIKAKEVILDGEGIGFNPKTGKFVPFQETIRRKRKHDIGETVKEIPIKFFVFDLMYKDGRNLMKTSFIERRKILERILPSSNKTLILTPQIRTNDPGEVRRFHDEQIKLGLEGAMVKKLHAPYDPGRRNFTWVKFKQEETKKGGGLADTIDCLVLGVYRGRGKRATFGVGAFLVGVLKDKKYLSLSKIGTGLTDEQWREINKQSKGFKTVQKPANYEVDRNLTPDSWLSPGLVVEIQADNVTKSPLHAAGLALRFPRLVRFRPDKSAERITTLGEVEELFRLQYGK